jgi:hypothetical protein
MTMLSESWRAFGLAIKLAFAILNYTFTILVQ